MLRIIASAVIVWFVWRFLNNLFGPSPRPKARNKKTSGAQTSDNERRSRVPKEMGEYVDYEEVKDE